MAPRFSICLIVTVLSQFSVSTLKTAGPAFILRYSPVLALPLESGRWGSKLSSSVALQNSGAPKYSSVPLPTQQQGGPLGHVNVCSGTESRAPKCLHLV